MVCRFQFLIRSLPLVLRPSYVFNISTKTASRLYKIFFHRIAWLTHLVPPVCLKHEMKLVTVPAAVYARRGRKWKVVSQHILTALRNPEERAA